jgi:hypothetical protein
MGKKKAEQLKIKDRLLLPLVTQVRQWSDRKKGRSAAI